jgi:hypothetical protein
MTETVLASDIHPDVLQIAQKIGNEVADLLAGIETLDANNWLKHADVIEELNLQLQSLLIVKPKNTSEKVK